MKRVFEDCKYLIEKNALHRKGFRIGEQKPLDHIMYGIGEIGELRQAELDAEIYTLVPEQHPAHQLEELADTINCLAFYAASKGFTPEQIEAECLRKLSIRLTVTPTEEKKP